MDIEQIRKAVNLCSEYLRGVFTTEIIIGELFPLSDFVVVPVIKLRIFSSPRIIGKLPVKTEIFAGGMQIEPVAFVTAGKSGIKQFILDTRTEPDEIEKKLPEILEKIAEVFPEAAKLTENVSQEKTAL